MDSSHDYINVVRLTSRLERACANLPPTADALTVNNLLASSRFGLSVLQRLQSHSTAGPSHPRQEPGSLPDLEHRLQAVENQLAGAAKPVKPTPARKQLPPQLEALRPPKPKPPQPHPSEAENPEPPTAEPALPAKSAREELLDRPPSLLQQRGSNATSKSQKSDPRETADSAHLMQHHREVQEGLTEDLAGMARQLKLNSLHFADSLEKDKGLVGSVEDRMSGNYDSMQSNRTRLGAYERKGGWTFCFTMMAVAGVCCAWFFMFALIRIT